MNLSFEELTLAYFECRKRKRSTLYAIDFEFDQEKNLYDLFEDIKENRYLISKSVAFVVDQPKIREIWCSTFRDRIVHHVIYNRLAPRFVPTFIRNSFACIPTRGTLDASNRLWNGMRKQTHNWKRSSYFLGADVRNFFVSIDKETLFKILLPKIHEKWLQDLVEQVIFHDPRIDCVRKSSEAAFKRVPPHKSLWQTPQEKGLPIGNLTSQFFANVYLNELDQFAKHTLKAKQYYRYVDDFIFLDQSPVTLNDHFQRCSDFLRDHLKLELHPFKKRLGLVDQGIDFVGHVHKPYRRYMRDRTVNKMKSAVHTWKKNPRGFHQQELEHFRSTLNSYLGLAVHANTYKLRKHIGNSVSSLFMAPDAEFRKLTITDYSRKRKRKKKMDFKNL